MLGFFLPSLAGDPLATMRSAAAACDGEPGAARGEGPLLAIGRSGGTAGGAVLLVDGRPSLAGVEASPDAIAELLERRGRAGLAELSGPFALAYVDPAARRVLLAVDRMGVGRMCYRATPDGVLFGNRASQLVGLPGVGNALRIESVFHYLFFHMVPSPWTIYTAILKLPRATVLEWRDGKHVVDSYWTPDFSRRGQRDARALREELHARLETAVRRAGPDADTGAFLSGGLDSSTVAGYLARVAGPGARTFSIGFDVDAFDELGYARIAARHFGCDARECNVSSGDIVEVFDQLAGATDEPFGNSSIVPTFICARLAAREGITQLLAGDGGDEIFGGNERYAKQKLFEAYGHVPRWMRAALIEPLTVGTRLTASVPVLKKLRRYVEQAQVPLPDRLGGNFAFSSGLAHRLTPEFMAEVDAQAPLEHMREVYGALPGGDTLDRLLAYDWRFTLADNDLRKVGSACELAGVRVAYPMLDEDVIDLSIDLPSSEKIRRLELRSFYKHAMRGFLPDEILTKSKHGFGLPFGVWLKTDADLRELVYGHLEGLGRRGFFQDGFIDEVMAGHRDGPASFFGYFIWDLAMLDAWLGSHGHPA